MSGRERLSLKSPPASPSDLANFPRRELGPGSTLWRVVDAGRGPWWFNCSPGGRFNLSAPFGTCYVAADPLSALLEVLGPDLTDGLVPAEFLARRRMRCLDVPRLFDLADLTSRAARVFGVTLEIHTITPYDLPQAWARQLHRAGRHGVAYFLRHDPSAGLGFGIFGRAGERTSWKRGRLALIGPDLMERLRREAGVIVAGIPNSVDLSVADQ